MAEQLSLVQSWAQCRYSYSSRSRDEFAHELQLFMGLYESYNCENSDIIRSSKFRLNSIRQLDGSLQSAAELHHIQGRDTPETVEGSLEKICLTCPLYQPKSEQR